MTDLVALVGATAGKELFKKVVGDLYGFVCERTGRKIRQWNTERKIETLYRKMSLVRKVKTIWQVDKPVDLSAFYCDSHVVIDKKRKTIRKLEDLGARGNLLLEGIAGQGKSIFLRYLCAVELAQGSIIPLFLELRRIDSTHSLRNRIYAAFSALGLDVDDDLFEALAASGKVLLLLDAFDEVPENLKSSVLTDIEDIADQYEDMRIIVTSRPHQTVRASRHFSIVTLDNLDGDEYAQVVIRLAKGQAWAASLVDHIEQRASHIKPLLCTPLMVTLLVLLYKSYQHLPAKLSEFYDTLFQILLQRHDGTKPGFTRDRSCDLDDIQYRNVFEAVCLFAKKNNQQTFTAAELRDITKNALMHCKLETPPAAYVNDIVRITCLILREGEEHRFIHKTVQEYYTAAFVCSKPEPWAKQFYTRILKNKSQGGWWQELDFLSEIDTYRYNRYFWLPAHLAALEISEKQLQSKRPKVSMKQAKSLLAPLFFNFQKTGMRAEWISIDMPFLHDLVITEVARLVIDKKFAVHDLPKIPSSVLKKHFRTHKIMEGHFRRYKNIQPASMLLDKPEFGRLALAAIDAHFDRLFLEAQKLSTALKKIESPSLLDGLI
ncbi:MAG: NACHT domain-containing protein [Desulfobulbaceae bacterium]|nr:NACHT domain-containing protein [Desulfobulbaceae bacterium]